MSRTIVIGDVHGCLDELQDLLKTVRELKKKVDELEKNVRPNTSS